MRTACLIVGLFAFSALVVYSILITIAWYSAECKVQELQQNRSTLEIRWDEGLTLQNDWSQPSPKE